MTETYCVLRITGGDYECSGWEDLVGVFTTKEEAEYKLLEHIEATEKLHKLYMDRSAAMVKATESLQQELSGLRYIFKAPRQRDRQAYEAYLKVSKTQETERLRLITAIRTVRDKISEEFGQDIRYVKPATLDDYEIREVKVGEIVEY